MKHFIAGIAAAVITALPCYCETGSLFVGIWASIMAEYKEIASPMQAKVDLSDAESESKLRKSWYGEVAYVMSSMKMSVDPPHVNAAIYANLVRQAVERNKQLAKMPPMAGMLL